MNNKQEAELNFWKETIASDGDGFATRRANDLARRQAHIDMDLKGKGLEIGCGCLSMFEFSDAEDVVAIDPLMDEYKKLYQVGDSVKYLSADGESLPFESDSFDWVTLFNVIDHTPNPSLMMSEIKRVLKSGGYLYFDVNFDDQLSPCHYGLWTIDTVREFLGDFKLIDEKLVRNSVDRQFNYYAKYTI